MRDMQRLHFFADQEEHMSINRFPTYFIPHGAGPCFFMDWDPPQTWDAMKDWLSRLVEDAGARPQAILVISGHWEAQRFTLNTAQQPDLLFDYNGFPPHTYELTWPAQGDPALVQRVAQLLEQHGIDYDRQERALDHGVFIPLKLAVPQADIPVLQLSLQQSLDPQSHLALGRALEPLRDEGVLIVGTGMSFHNMRRFRMQGGDAVDPDSERFDTWLAETVALPAAEREQRLQHWDQAPGGRASHPREEHLLPLHVIAGAGGSDAGVQVFQDRVLGSVQSAFRMGTPIT